MIWVTERTRRELLDQSRGGQRSSSSLGSICSQSSGTGGENPCKLNGILHENFFPFWKTKEERKILAEEEKESPGHWMLNWFSFRVVTTGYHQTQHNKRSLKGNNQCKITLNCVHGPMNGLLNLVYCTIYLFMQVIIFAFWLRQELRVSQCACFCPSVRHNLV